MNHYYPESSLVQSDGELQAWWTEVRTKGHADKMDEAWWPVLETTKNLAYNTRTIMPIESPCKDEFKKFLMKPEDELLKCFPSQIQATTVISLLNAQSCHSPDEEYIGIKC